VGGGGAGDDGARPGVPGGTTSALGLSQSGGGRGESGAGPRGEFAPGGAGGAGGTGTLAGAGVGGNGAPGTTGYPYATPGSPGRVYIQW
jgi:hypothetical protein